MNATEKRAALMEAAAKLQGELAMLREAIRPMSQLVADMIGAADSLLLASAEEITSGEVRKVKQVRTKPGGEVVIEGTDEHPEVRRGGTRLVAGSFAGYAPSDVPVAPARIAAVGKRKCSVCRKPGHRAQNCPNAHVVQEQKKAAVAARPVKRKRTMKPLSPERKAQLIATLAKARAAKKGKS